LALKDRLRRVQQEATKILPAYEVVTLKDGKEVFFPAGSRLQAFLAAYNQEDHPLLGLIEGDEIDLGQNPEMREYSEFLKSFQANAETEDQ
jgi:hypothetical protein